LAEKNKIKDRVERLKKKSQQMDIERRQQALKEKEYLKRCAETGKQPRALQKSRSATGAALKGLQAKELKAKIAGATARLAAPRQNNTAN